MSLRTAAPAGRSRLRESDQLTAVGGLAALALDAMASVAYGPEAIVLVLATAGGAGIGLTLPITLAIAALLAVLVASYRSVIAAFPDGGGAYAVSRRRLGRHASLVAAASLIVDYVLNVAVSIAAGIAALTSAFPSLRGATTWLCLVTLVVVTVVNLRGIAHSARVFIAPTVVFVASIAAIIVVGLFRSEPLHRITGGDPVAVTHTVGVLLLLKAFSSGCAALTGVEAIANAVPSFRDPGVRRAQRAEVALGALLGSMLIGLGYLIQKFDIRPVEGVTVLSQLTSATLGRGVLYVVVQLSTVLLLALAANTSFGGLPTLFKVLAADHFLPHRFAHRSAHDVYRWGVLTLSGLAALLLVAAGGQMNTLVPLFAIGVFVGFTLAQVGMVLHWRAVEPQRWLRRAVPNAAGAVATGVALVITASVKFAEGAWLIVVAIALLVPAMAYVRRSYDDQDDEREEADPPARPRRDLPTVALVPVRAVDEVSRRAIETALSMAADRVVAVHVAEPGDLPRTTALERDWQRWGTGVPLVVIDGDQGDVASPIAAYVEDRLAGGEVLVVLGEPRHENLWEEALSDASADRIAQRLTGLPHVTVCRQVVAPPTS